MKNTSAEPVIDDSSKTQVLEEPITGKVDVVVQEYMDNLLSDLFPSLDEDASEKIEVIQAEKTETSLKPVEALKEVIADPSVVQPPPAVVTEEAPVKTYAKVIPHVPLNDDILKPVAVSAEPEVKTETVPKSVLPVKEALIETPQAKIIPSKVTAKEDVKPELSPEVKNQVKADTQSTVQTETVAVEKRFPNAPDWAQEAFDVLLFDVCGLKLAVPMESLGRIIKVEHETNQLIGRPGWFIGAYNEADEHLYVVDTAKYIMPEKGYDLEQDGFDYLIQMQRSKWTLACQNVHTTVRLEPDQVKWRSSEGKRQWLSGTVIEHMCALVHVDKLIELLEADS